MNKKQSQKKLKLKDSGNDVYTAEKLLKKRVIRNQTQYLVKWKGWSIKHNTWEPDTNILDNSK